MPIMSRVKKIRLPISMSLLAAVAGLGGLFYTPLIALSVLLILSSSAIMLKFARSTELTQKEHLEIHKIINETSSFEHRESSHSELSTLEVVDSKLGSDPETGFITYPVFSAILEAKVATARRRLWPVTIVQIQLAFLEDSQEFSGETIASIIGFSSIVRQTLREADVVARIGRGRFAIILEDTDEEGAAWVAERIQVAQVQAGSTSISKISAGVAGYPTNGASSKDLVTRSTLALEHALSNRDEPGIGRVIVAPTVPYSA